MHTERFDYASANVENIPCNLCGSFSFVVIAGKISNGQRVETCLCKKCGLVYINPRMTRKEYDRYYKTYYHEERLRTKGRTETRFKDPAGDGFNHAFRFGKALAEDFRKWIEKGRVVDVGSAYGGLLAGIKDTIPDISVMGIEPSAEDAAYANTRGIPTHNVLFEDFSGVEACSLSAVFCVQTFNHLLDPRGFLVWAHNHLYVGGAIILAVKNFRQQCRRAGSIASSVQIDHPYMFTPETLSAMVRSLGFEIVYMDVDEYKNNTALQKQNMRGISMHHIRLVAKKVRPSVVSRLPVHKGKGVFRLRVQLFLPYIKLYHVVVYGVWRKRFWLKNP